MKKVIKELLKIMDLPQMVIGIMFSGLCLLAIVVRIIFPHVLIDLNTVYFLLLFLVPWLGIYWLSIKFKDIEGKPRQGGKSSTEENPPPPSSPTTTTTTTQAQLSTISDVFLTELSIYAKRVMATLWKYQKQTFADDISRRWTFLIYSGSQAYIEYIMGAGELLQRGFITMSIENSQVMLTNTGIDYLNGHSSEFDNYQDYYRF